MRCPAALLNINKEVSCSFKVFQVMIYPRCSYVLFVVYIYHPTSLIGSGTETFNIKIFNYRYGSAPKTPFGLCSGGGPIHARVPIHAHP